MADLGSITVDIGLVAGEASPELRALLKKLIVEVMIESGTGSLGDLAEQIAEHQKKQMIVNG